MMKARDPKPAGAENAQDREAAARDQAADDRDQVAVGRDLAAAERDRVASSGDEKADRKSLGGGASRAARDREYAGGDREQAGGDRKQARGDRRHAGGDRKHAARDRDEAAIALQALAEDELTRTRRRGPGLDELQREIDRARRTNQQLAVAYVDVDGLKAINDTKGHAAGDELLLSVTDALRSHLRSYDSIVRLGGDEFLCILPGTGIDGARSAIDHVRDGIVESTGHVSISVGFAQLEPEESREGLIARADENLIATRRQDSPPAHR